MNSHHDIEKFGVFQVFTGGGTGTGFLIDKQFLLTNCHVVAPYRDVAIEVRNKTRLLGRVRRLHPKRDLAVVELEQPIDTEILVLSEEGDVHAKQALNILGFPIGLPLSLTEGVVSHPRQLFDGQHFVQTDAAINPGNSGGPMLDEERRIVAVTTCKLRSADLVGFGIPSRDVHAFVQAFREQTADFGVECPACGRLIETADRYCDGCGSDLEHLDLSAYFTSPDEHPIVAFVESSLRKANKNPILARHGAQNWSFYSGSAPIRIWCCCSEHLCFSAPLAQPGKGSIGPLFRHLLSAEHAPFAYDLDGNVIRQNLTVHMADVFGQAHDEELASWITRFLTRADLVDDQLIREFGCEPAPETQVSELEGHDASHP